MSRPAYIVCLEENPRDFEAIIAGLRAEHLGFEAVRTADRSEFVAALERKRADLILIGDDLPERSEFDARKVAGELCPNSPLIILSSTLNDEATLALRGQGVCECISKKDLGRLGPAARRALERNPMDSSLSKIGERFSQLHQCLFHFGSQPQENIDRLVARTGEVFKAQWVLLVWKTGDRPQMVSGWSAVSPLEPDVLEGICLNATANLEAGHEPSIIHGMNQRQAETAKRPPSASVIETCVSVPVSFNGRKEGSLLLLFGPRQEPDANEVDFLKIIALALGIEKERLRAESALRDRELRFRAMIENSADCLALVNQEGRLIYASPSISRLLGYSREELDDRDAFEFVHPDEAEKLRGVFAGLLSRPGSQAEEVFRLRSKSGEWRWVVGTCSNSLEDPALRSLVINFRDITERLLAEEQIRQQADLLEQVQDAIGVRDMNDRLVFWSKGAERMYGWTAEEAIGRNSVELLYQKLPAIRDEAVREVIEKGVWHGELQQQNKKGELLVVDSRWKLLLNAAGQPTGILVTNSDITEKKQMEGHMLRAQRLEAIGTLASGIAHDLNNILSPILISVQILRARNLDEESQNLLATIEQCANRGSEVVKQVLTFGRGLKGERVAIQPRYLIGEMAKIARETFPKTIQVQTSTPPNLWPIVGDATQLHQLLLNLCVNARDAMPSGGKLGLRAENFIVDEHFAKMARSAKPGQHVLIQISDTGIGIGSDIINRIFDPFFTTKETGQGSGLGLATVLGIVTGHSGFILVDSAPGRGANFKVYLPAQPGAETPAETAPTQPPPAGRGELILIVDDEKDIREVSQKILSQHGYEVLMAEDGTEAISLFAQHRSRVKLILTDLMMPYMDGLALVRALRKIDPLVKIVASSGYLGGMEQSDKVAQLHGMGVNVFLNKPYNAEKLLRAVGGTLHS